MAETWPLTAPELAWLEGDLLWRAALTPPPGAAANPALHPDPQPDADRLGAMSRQPPEPR